MDDLKRCSAWGFEKARSSYEGGYRCGEPAVRWWVAWDGYAFGRCNRHRNVFPDNSFYTGIFREELDILLVHEA